MLLPGFSLCLRHVAAWVAHEQRALPVLLLSCHVQLCMPPLWHEARLLVGQSYMQA
jgi:hypothetical protein